MESLLKYFEENYDVFECFNGCLDSFMFESETERYIDILMGMINEFYTKDIISLKEKASKHEKFRVSKDNEGKCFLEITGKNNKTTNLLGEGKNLIINLLSTNIKIGDLLFAGILISSLGAVMDVGMSIASTLNELQEKKEIMSVKELFASGMNVGRDMMGTMSNTLILAFTGGSLNTLVFIYAYDYPYLQIINIYSIGIELMQGLSASMGVVLTVPFTSLIGAWLLGKRKGVKTVKFLG